MARGTDQVYLTDGMSGLNSDPSDPWKGIERVFDEAEFYNFLVIGWISSKDRFYFNNNHLTFWHVDEIVDTLTPDGWGVNFSSSF